MKFIILILSLNLSLLSMEKYIVISKASGSESYTNYYNWIKKFDSDLKVIDLNGMTYDSVVYYTENASGIILSGGPDINPNRYGKGEQIDFCSIDETRDTVDFKIIEISNNKKIPILGICRGFQILNVAFGGSLLVDIPKFYDKHIDRLHQTPEPGDALHTSKFIENSLLNNILNVSEEIINCNHHQGIDILSEHFIATSYAEDKQIESLEFKDKTNKQWLIGVQWHPERAKNENVSNNIAKEFLKQAEIYFNSRKN